MPSIALEYRLILSLSISSPCFIVHPFLRSLIDGVEEGFFRESVNPNIDRDIDRDRDRGIIVLNLALLPAPKILLKKSSLAMAVPQ